MIKYNFLMKNLFALLLAGVMMLPAGAQNWQKDKDTFLAEYCYREKDGKWLDALTDYKIMTNMPTDDDIVQVYYWRIPEGKVRADMIWTNKYARYVNMHVKVIRPVTGEVLGENDFSNPDIIAKERTNDLFGTIDFPADEFYRIEITCDKWNYIKQISNFVFQRESTKPVMKPRNFGGTSAHMWNWYSTDPAAPSGSAYDWAYIEAMVPQEYSYPGTYYMTIGAMSGYMGMQTVGPMGEPGDFSRSVLFSVWDAGNMDEDPNLPEYMQSGVMSGNPDAVHTHAGGEGSSASVMLKGDTKWWRPDKWVQFLENSRPETVTIFGQTRDGRDTSFIYENTICTAFYKMHDEPTWRYLGTIRSSGQNEHMAGWYSFIEPFTTYAGQMKHRALYRHAAMRSVNSGKWYSRNKVDFWDDEQDRDFHYDYGRGASQEFDNCFFFEMGGYGVHTDSAKVTNLATDMSFVESINLDSLNAIIDASVKRDQTILFNTKIDQTADNCGPDVWKPIADLCSNGREVSRAFDKNEKTGWICSGGYPYTLALEADEVQTVTSFNFFWEYKYDYRCLYVDLATSDDGQNWTSVFDSLEIRSGIDRPNISFPHAIKTKYIKLSFYKPFTTNSFMISEFNIRGDYDADRIIALAHTELSNANGLNHYAKDDLAGVQAAYDKVKAGAIAPQDLESLAMALKQVANEAPFYKYSRVARNYHISSQRAYCIQNKGGHGILMATPDGKLTMAGATIAGALGQYAEPADITDPYSAWMILHDEHYGNAYYAYNLGAKKFLAVANGAVALSQQPHAFSVNMVGDAYSFQTGKDLVATNALSAQGVTLYGSAEREAVFYLYDNYQFAQSIEMRDSVQQITELIDKVNYYQENIDAMLKAPVGVVGGFTSEAARQVLEDAYNNRKANPQAFIEAVENADVIEFDADNFVYRIKNTQDDAAPFMTADASSKHLVGKAASNDPDHIWRFAPKGGGYSMHSQGLMPMPIPSASNSVVSLTADYAESGTYVLFAEEWGKNCISSAQYYTYVIGNSTSAMKTTNSRAIGATWYLEPITSYSVALNSVGVSSFYADFAVVVPEGLQAYVANHVSPDGVIKLTQIAGVVPPRTPVLLRGEKFATHNLEVLNTQSQLDAANIFNGSYFADGNFAKGSVFTLSSFGGKPIMKKPAISRVGANEIYLVADSAWPDLSTYTFDFDDLVDSVDGYEYSDAAATANAANGPIFDLQGRRVLTTVKGHVYIRNHTKVSE